MLDDEAFNASNVFLYTNKLGKEAIHAKYVSILITPQYGPRVDVPVKSKLAREDSEFLQGLRTNL